MPLNDATTVAASVYAEQKTHTKQAPTMANNISASKTDGLYSSSSNGNNKSPNGTGGCALLPEHAFYNFQGHKWQQVFDFDKVLKQLRSAEKTFLRGKSDKNVSHSGNSSGGSATKPVVIQVQRLYALDMPFFDLAPKQTARDVVICSVCKGYYTKMGFNSHMMLQHPAVWSSVPSKLSSTHAADTAHSGRGHHSSATDSALDHIREGEVAAASPPTDMSGTVSTCSSSSSSLSSPYTTAVAAGSTATAAPVGTATTQSTSSSSSSSRHKSSKSSSSKTGSSSSSRSRTKTKHTHHTSSSSSTISTTTESSTTTQSSHKSSSKKGSSSAHASATHIAPPVTIKEVSEAAAVLPITVYSSSSSNSSCSLPPTPKTQATQDVGGNTILSNSTLDIGAGVYSPATNLLSTHSDIKEKHHSGEHSSSKKKAKITASVGLSQETVDSSTTMLSSAASSEFASHKLRTQLAKAPTKTINASQLPPYELQMNELDQAVSSITGVSGVNVKVSQLNEAQYSQQTVLQPTVGNSEEPMQHNTSDDNSISLSLDDMLDSKFINEILNTAESEMPFDESVLDPALQQPGGNVGYMQQSSSKRMRYDDGTIQMSSAGHNAELGVGEYTTAVYHQQQEQYDPNNLEAMKLYNQEIAIAGEHQPQLTTIDAMQLQQLIYQQQQMLEAEQKQMEVDGYATLAYETQQPIAAAAAASQQFSVYNVPSLTDDNVVAPPETQLEMMPTSIIYEITDNNQVSVMDQQSQQQVIAEFLTQAGYDNVEQMSNVLTEAEGNENGATNGIGFNNGTVSGSSRWAEFNDLCDIDFSKMETVTTITSTSASTTSSSSTTETKTVKMEANDTNESILPPNYQPHRQLTHTKYHDDFYFNVFLYSGIPRPLAMNTFGLVKLPQSAGTTFRKHLLSTRKTNNSLLTLGGVNGVIGSNYPLHVGGSGNTKQSFYGGNAAGTGNVNEFSIGSITITNASGNNGIGGSNSNAQHNNVSSGKSKSTPATLSAITPTATSSFNNASATMRGTITNGGGGNSVGQAKTIHVNKSNTIPNERIKCVKRALVSKIDYNKNGIFTIKKVNDLLNGKLKDRSKEKEKPSVSEQNVSEASNELQQQHQQQEDVAKYSRMHSFYEKRRKLMHMSADNYSQNEHNHQNLFQARNQHHLLRSQAGHSPPTPYTQKQRQEKLLKKQLMRTLSDCGMNQWKSNSNSPSGASTGSGSGTPVPGNDLMRVFV